MTLVPLPQELRDGLADKFGHVSTWVFDLDNTLYPPDCGLWPQIEERITLFLIEHHRARRRVGARVAALLLPSPRHDAARARRRGLRSSAEEFLDFVHDVDRSGLTPEPRARREIARLPGRKLIFTNGSRDHALATVAQLGLDGLFEDAFDIVAAGLMPKPAAAAYEAFFAPHGVDPRARGDVRGHRQEPRRRRKARGMTTMLVTPRAGQRDDREPPTAKGPAPGYVDFVTDDLAGFLGSVNDRLAAPRARPLAAE